MADLLNFFVFCSKTRKISFLLYNLAVNNLYSLFGALKSQSTHSQHTLYNAILHCNPLQGKYRFFTGNSLCSISTLTCFGSVQGLKDKNFIEIQGNICILYRNIALDIYIHVYVLITGISLLFEKQQHRILEKQGKTCK